MFSNGMEFFGPKGSFKVLYSVLWHSLVMESLIRSFMTCMILFGLVWFSIVYTNIFPCKVSNGLVWLCMVLYGLMQLCTIFWLVKLKNDILHAQYFFK